MSQHDTLTQALQQIADWNSHTTEYAVDYGSNGVRDFYRNIARAALSATQPAQAAQSEPVKPLFAAKIAARKWAELQDALWFASRLDARHVIRRWFGEQRKRK